MFCVFWMAMSVFATSGNLLDDTKRETEYLASLWWYDDFSIISPYRTLVFNNGRLQALPHPSLSLWIPASRRAARSPHHSFCSHAITPCSNTTIKLDDGARSSSSTLCQEQRGDAQSRAPNLDIQTQKLIVDYRKQQDGGHTSMTAVKTVPSIAA